MVDAATRSFRARGFAGVGVDGIAEAAGVTSGALYAHFGSKRGAFEAALERGFDEGYASMIEAQAAGGEDWLTGFVASYLGAAHRADMAGGCTVSTLACEVIREGGKAPAIFERRMAGFIARFAEGLAGGDGEARRARARATIATLAGGLSIARAVESREEADRIVAAVTTAALSAAGPTAAAPDP
ncbi:MAG: helix-turn-helix domain-containing protein [Pseudomonadota bacterium]